MSKFSAYEYRKLPGFDMNTFEGANQAIPMKTLAIMDFEASLNYDIKLLRESPAVPKHIKLYGFFYEISSGKFVCPVNQSRTIRGSKTVAIITAATAILSLGSRLLGALTPCRFLKSLAVGPPSLKRLRLNVLC